MPDRDDKTKGPATDVMRTTKKTEGASDGIGNIDGPNANDGTGVNPHKPKIGADVTTATGA